MNTTMKLKTIAISALVVAALGYAAESKREAMAIKATAEAQEEADMRLGQYTLNMIYKSGAGNKISDGRKQVFARAIVRVSNEIFDNLEQTQAWISAIAIESAFMKFAQSPTGPKGLGQMARASFHEGIAKCSINKVADDDVFETDLALYSSACYFKSMLEISNGDPFGAMVLYNKGPNSEDARTYLKSGNLNDQEALKYIAKATFLKRNVTDQKTIGVPLIQDLNKSAKSTSKVKSPKSN